MTRRSRKTPLPKYDLLWEIMADAGLSSSAKCVAVALLFRFRNHKTGQCNPSFAAIAATLGRTRRPTIDAVQELQARGWIELVGTKGGGRGNTNSITFCAGPGGGTVLPTAPLQASEKVPPTAPVLCTTERVLQTAHEPSRTTSPYGEDVEEERGCVRAPDGAHEELFSLFWEQFPLLVDRKAAAVEFQRVLTSGQVTPSELIEAAGRYKEACDGKDPQFIARPANWLKNERWTDGPLPVANNAARVPSRGKKPSLTEIALRHGGFNVPEGWQQ